MPNRFKLPNVAISTPRSDIMILAWTKLALCKPKACLTLTQPMPADAKRRQQGNNQYDHANLALGAFFPRASLILQIANCAPTLSLKPSMHSSGCVNPVVLLASHVHMACEAMPTFLGPDRSQVFLLDARRRFSNQYDWDRGFLEESNMSGWALGFPFLEQPHPWRGTSSVGSIITMSRRGSNERDAEREA